MQANRLITLTLAASVLMACDNLQQAQSAEPSDNLAQVAESLTDKTLRANQAAYIPPQCYTKTRDANGQVHNPCMSCHIPSTEPNYLNDGNLQLGYDFADYARTNHWRNLFKDRRTAIAMISDQSILDYVRQNNYQSPTGVLDLAAKLMVGILIRMANGAVINLTLKEAWMPTTPPRRLAHARGTSGLPTRSIPAGCWTTLLSLLIGRIDVVVLCR